MSLAEFGSLVLVAPVGVWALPSLGNTVSSAGARGCSRRS